MTMNAYTECHYAECQNEVHYAVCHYAEFHLAECGGSSATTEHQHFFFYTMA
jgi:hypothetical protein